MEAWEEYREAVQACGDTVRKARTQLELNLVMDVNSNKKDLYKYARNKRKSRGNVGLLLNGEGALETKRIEKAEVLNAFFASVFTSKASLQEFQAPEIRWKIWSKEDLPLMEEDRVRE